MRFADADAARREKSRRPERQRKGRRQREGKTRCGSTTEAVLAGSTGSGTPVGHFAEKKTAGDANLAARRQSWDARLTGQRTPAPPDGSKSPLPLIRLECMVVS